MPKFEVRTVYSLGSRLLLRAGSGPFTTGKPPGRGDRTSSNFKIMMFVRLAVMLIITFFLRKKSVKDFTASSI